MKTIKIGTNAYYYKNEVGDGLLSYAQQGSKEGLGLVKKLVKKLNARCVKCGDHIISDEDLLCGQCI